MLRVGKLLGDLWCSLSIMYPSHPPSLYSCDLWIHQTTIIPYFHSVLLLHRVCPMSIPLTLQGPPTLSSPGPTNAFSSVFLPLSLYLLPDPTFQLIPCVLCPTPSSLTVPEVPLQAHQLLHDFYACPWPMIYHAVPVLYSHVHYPTHVHIPPKLPKLSYAHLSSYPCVSSPQAPPPSLTLSACLDPWSSKVSLCPWYPPFPTACMHLILHRTFTPFCPWLCHLPFCFYDTLKSLSS